MARKADLALIDEIAKDVGGLTKPQRRLLHDAITKQKYTPEEIKDIAQEIKELYPNKSRGFSKMQQSMIQEIANQAEVAIRGKKCWYVSCGGSAGTTFQLALGERVRAT